MDVTERALKAAIERRYGGTAHLAYIDAAPTTLQARSVCEGIVFVFDLEGHPEAQRAYGWTSPVGQNGERQFHVALQVLPMASEQDALRSMTADSHSTPHRRTGPRSLNVLARAGPADAAKPARAA
jgi:hypothetical protein